MDYEEEQQNIPVFRDGKVHVLASQCRTCIFRSGNLMKLEPGRVKEMFSHCVQADVIIPCHDYMDTTEPVVCRGLFNTGEVGILQLAERMGVIQFDERGEDHGA